MSSKETDKYEGLRILARYSGMGLQLLAILGLGVGIGYYADQQGDSTSQTYTVIGALIGVGIALYSLLRLIKEVKK
jgi:F0F1-type ATP synthase assembly protein I